MIFGNHYNSELYRFKVGAFFLRHSVYDRLTAAQQQICQ